MRTCYKIVLGVLSTFVNTLVAADCLDVQGNVQTQSINNQVQVGNLTMAPAAKSVPKFRAAFGQNFLAGGIRGEITSQVSMTVYLNHEIGFPGVGSLISLNDKADINFDPTTNGIFTVEESLDIVGTQNGGMFTGWTGKLVADGVLDTQKGVNTFSYSGHICKDS